MKENIATIPLIKAFNAKDECPFCNLEREAEQHAVSFILGSAYMEDDIREKTDTTGFCRHHFKMKMTTGTKIKTGEIPQTVFSAACRNVPAAIRQMKCSGQSCKMRSFGFMERNFQ